MQQKSFFQNWFKARGWKPFPFQVESWDAVANGYSGLVNAPTGSGKTYSLLLPFIQEILEGAQVKGVKLIWVSPIRALTKEIEIAANRVIQELNLPLRAEIRTGDTAQALKQKQLKNPPDILITTPETLHILLSRKDHPAYFQNLIGVVADEWHELLSSKRGVQAELFFSRVKAISPTIKLWAISATIANLDQALQVLVGFGSTLKTKLIKADIQKKISVIPLLPEKIEDFPWAGHTGIPLLPEVVKIIDQSKTTLIFTNTRSQTEIWYQRILEFNPDLAGLIAMHHSSIDKEIRNWVEDALQAGTLKAVVCTSSLDLGVDFSPVESIVQVGGPKGISRFLQRAGRSGHKPGAESKIFFMPTHAMEIFEASALIKAVDSNFVEARVPLTRCFDVLVQYLVTLACGAGFKSETLLSEIKTTHCFKDITAEEWEFCLNFVTSGGASLSQYPDFKKVAFVDNLFQVTEKRVAMRHRLSIGTIVSDSNLMVKFMSGGKIGSIEEWFITKLNPGDTFWFAGRNLELIQIKGNDVLVKKSNKKKGLIPSWMGGRMPLSANMSKVLRDEVYSAAEDNFALQSTLNPLIQIQKNRSAIPNKGELLIEFFKSREGYHLCVYPFEGRFVHEAISALLAYRLSLLMPVSFSIAFNDYGFELLTETEWNPEIIADNNLFTEQDLYNDLLSSVNAAEMAKRKFRDIASISGLIFQGFPGKTQKDKHLLASAQLFFKVFEEYEPSNLLYKQAFEEVTEQQLEFDRLYNTLSNLSKLKQRYAYPDRPTPFAFPIMVDRLREKLTSEKLEDRIEKMRLQLN
ncbi:MAG: ligase-associated DNA damage response DEXH box helicase [Luteibaculaceae bacterium]